MIDENKLKEYINTQYADEYHVNDINFIKMNKMRYFRDQVAPKPEGVASRYNDIIERDGSVEVLMIRVEWSGWKIVKDKYTHRPELAGTWAYHPDRSNRFNLDLYQEWLVDVRDKKLEELGL